jgi:hypothetical protein
MSVLAHLAERSDVRVCLLVDDDNNWLAHTHSTTHSLRNHNLRLAHTHTHTDTHVHSHILLSVAHLLVHHRLLITHILLLVAHLLMRVPTTRIVTHLLRRNLANLLPKPHLLLPVPELWLSVAHLLTLNHHRLLLVPHAHRLLHPHSRIDNRNLNSSIYKFRSEVESACWSSVEKDFNPLLSPTRDRKSLQWQLNSSDNG